MGRLVDLVGEVHAEGVAVVVAVLGLVGLGKVVDLPQVGDVGRPAKVIDRPDGLNMVIEIGRASCRERVLTGV